MIDVGLEGEDVRGAPQALRARRTRRGPPPRLRRAHARQAPGGDLVGGARGTRATARSVACCFARDEDGDVQAYADAVPDDATVRRRFDAIALAAPGCVSVEDADPGPPLRWEPAPGGDATLSAAPFDRRLDFDWRRTSYSNITAGTYEARVASEPEQGGVEDEPDAGIPLPGTGAGRGRRRARRRPVAARRHAGRRPRGDLRAPGPRGHRLRRARPARRAGARVREALAWRAVDVGPIEASWTACRRRSRRRSARSPAVARLRDLARGDRLDELEFELPLAGGDDPDGTVALGAIAASCARTSPSATRSRAIPTASRTRRCAPRSAATSPAAIDLVARLRGEDGGPRFAVVDYKTNHLGAAGRAADRLAPPPRRPRRGDGAGALRAAGPALHRRAAPLPALAPAGVRARSPPGGDPATCSCAAWSGPDTPAVDGVPCGVFAWRPPAALVEALSDALDAAA